jgi:hypothetical protein
VILDHIDSLQLPDAEVSSRANELQARDYLWDGLVYLARQVRPIEEEICQRVNCQKKKVMLYGNAPQFAGLAMGLVATAHHWYAVTACNYVRLVGWLGNSGDEKKALDYVEAVIPAVKMFRDKVGAHFAIVKARPEDTAAGLAASVMFPIGFYDRRLVANPMKLSMTKGGEKGTSPLEMWSLTETQEALAGRYTA